MVTAIERTSRMGAATWKARDRRTRRRAEGGGAEVGVTIEKVSARARRMPLDALPLPSISDMLVARSPMKEIRTETEIDAPAARVWEVLTDFSRYHEWNPLVPEASGELRAGGRLRLRVVAGREMRFRPVVVAFEPERTLR